MDETVVKHIDIGVDGAFNSGWLDIPDGKLLFYRHPVDKNGFTLLRCAQIDKNFNFVKPVKIYGRDVAIEDIRTVYHNGFHYLSGHNWTMIGGCSGARMEMARLEIHNDLVIPTWVARFENIEGYDYVPKNEKNWLPLSYNGELYYVYSLNPHTILKVDLDRKAVKLEWQTQFARSLWPIDGNMYLSSTPVKMRDGYYVGTFHVKNNNEYWTGAYRFEGTPPFRIVQVSSTPIITPHHATCTCPIGNFKLIFIQGMDIDEDKGIVRMIGGDSDLWISLVEMPLDYMMSTLKNVS